MTDQTPTPPAGPDRPNRITPRVVIAVAIAALLFVGIAGLIGAAVIGDDGPTTGAGLEPPVDVAVPAAPSESPAPQEPGPGAVPAPPAGAMPEADPSDSGPDASGPADSAAGGDDFQAAPPDGGSDQSDGASDASEPAPAVPVASIEPLGTDEVPALPDEPVELPSMVAPPVPTPTVAPRPLAELSLPGWDLVTSDDGYVELSDGNQVIEVFVVDPAPDAATALDRFLADRDDDFADFTTSPTDRLGAPASRWVSVSGAEYTGTRAGQQGTVTVTGSVVAGVDADGATVVIVSSRDGIASAAERSADGALVNALLAQLDPGATAS
jgi:hypothetical protein